MGGGGHAQRQSLEAQWDQMIRRPTIFQKTQSHKESTTYIKTVHKQEVTQRYTVTSLENTKDKERIPEPPEAEGRGPPD